MSNIDRLSGAALTAGLTAFGSYWLIFAIISSSCTRIFVYSDQIEAESTSTLAGFAIGSSIFVFFFVLLGKDQADKIEKIVALTLAAVFVLWIAFVMVDGNVCSPLAWRKYVAYLVVPSLVATIVIIGRKWLSAHD